jgi:hypothetical protein
MNNIAFLGKKGREFWVKTRKYLNNKRQSGRKRGQQGFLKTPISK